MQQKYYTTRLFIGLFIITMLISYIALDLSNKYNQIIMDGTINDLQITIPQHPTVPKQPSKILDTTNWLTYVDKAHPLTFSYPKGWTVQTSPETKNGFYNITIKPLDKTPNFHISISRNGFLGLDGLKLERYQVAGVEGKSVNGNLIGVKTGEYYFTFDASLNSSKLPEFTTMMSTVAFQ